MIRLIASLFVVVAGLGPLAADVNAQNIICWTNDNGRRVCGDRIPTDQVRHDREILNSQGVVIRQEQGELTDEELAVISAQEAERQRQEQEAAERLRYGQVLLDSYTSVASIEALGDRTVAQIDGQIVVFEAYLDSLNDKLENLGRQSQRYAPHSERENAPPMPEVLTRDIEATKSSIELYEQRLIEMHRNKEETRDSFEQDIAYFRELKRSDG